MIVILFENLLLDPNFLTHFEVTWKLSSLSTPASELRISKVVRMNKSLLSSFAAYLKGDDEPKEEDIDHARTALGCVSGIDFTESIFKNKNLVTSNFVEVLLESIHISRSLENERFFEHELLFLIETSIFMTMFHKLDNTLYQIIFEKVNSILNDVDILSKDTVRRLASYKLILLPNLDNSAGLLIEFINQCLLKQNEIFTEDYFDTDEGEVFISRILQIISEMKSGKNEVLSNEYFWEWSLLVSNMKKHSMTIYTFQESIIQNENNITKKNLKHVLKLLDSIATLGSIGSVWEIEYDRLVLRGDHPDINENPHQGLIDISLKSVNMTARLLKENEVEDFSNDDIITVIQTLVHQCLNPCDQIRSYALSSLEDAILENRHINSGDGSLIEKIIEQGLTPVISDLTNINSTGAQSDEDDRKKHDLINHMIVSMIGRIYLYYLKQGICTANTYMIVLGAFNHFVDDPKMETELQRLITEKDKIEAERDTSVVKESATIQTN